MEGLVAWTRKRTRLDKELARVEAEEKSEASSPVQESAAGMIEQERQRLVRWSNQRAGLREQRAKL